MYRIEVREWDEEGVLVELRGEFDLHNLEELRETMSNTVALQRPTMVDLSGVTFIDVEAIRELTIRSRLYAHHLTLCNPSWQVEASVAACGLGEWFAFRSEMEGPSRRWGFPDRIPFWAIGGRPVF